MTDESLNDRAQDDQPQEEDILIDNPAAEDNVEKATGDLEQVIMGDDGNPLPSSEAEVPVPSAQEKKTDLEQEHVQVVNPSAEDEKHDGKKSKKKSEKKPSLFRRLFSRKKPLNNAESSAGEKDGKPDELIKGLVSLDESSDNTKQAAPVFTLDEVRNIVAEELNKAHVDDVKILEAKLDQILKERRLRSLSFIKESFEDLNQTKAEFLVEQYKKIQEIEQHILQEGDRPVKEMLEDLSMLRERAAQVEAELAELESEFSYKAGEQIAIRESLEHHPVISKLQNDLEQQKELIQKAPSQKPVINPTLVVIFIVALALVGIAGIWLPLPTETRSEANSRLLVETAALYQASGEKDDALRLLDEAVAGGVKDPDLLGRIGNMYRLLVNYDKAIEILSKALESQPDNETYLLGLARSYAGSGKNQDSIDTYLKLIQIKPGFTSYYLELGNRYRVIKDYGNAIIQFQKAITIKANFWQAYNALGDTYRDQSLFDDAIAAYQKANEIYPENYIGVVDIGLSYASKGEFGHAIEQYQAAIGLNPEKADAYFYIGEAYLAQGLLDEAIDPYKQAIGINEKYTAAYVGLGKIYVTKGDCTEAALQFTQALKIDPKNKDATEGLNVCKETSN